jgi:hypothetical protein
VLGRYEDSGQSASSMKSLAVTSKRGIGGVYHSVSAKYLQGYINEYAWTYNHRDDTKSTFFTLLLRAANGSLWLFICLACPLEVLEEIFFRGYWNFVTLWRFFVWAFVCRPFCLLVERSLTHERT